MQGVNAVFQELVGIFFLKFLGEFLINRVQHLRHAQGNAPGVIEIIVRHPPGHRLASASLSLIRLWKLLPNRSLYSC